jgi:hypothetical protein
LKEIVAGNTSVVEQERVRATFVDGGNVSRFQAIRKMGGRDDIVREFENNSQ